MYNMDKVTCHRVGLLESSEMRLPMEVPYKPNWKIACLASESPEFELQPCITQAWWHTPKSQYPGGGGRRIKAILGYGVNGEARIQEVLTEQTNE